MEKVFHSIAYEGANRQLLAAWIIEGEGAGAKALFVWLGDHYSALGSDACFPEACMREILSFPRGKDGIWQWEHCRVFLEQISEGRRLVICGAGHVSISVIRIAVMLDYEVTVIEDRESFAQRAKDVGAQHVICAPFEEALDEVEGDFTTAFIIMTRSHAHDLICLEKILKKPYAYAGMMGSRSRTGQIRQMMLEEGYDPRKVEQLHMPIGLAIGSRTPEEIAVSVMAELISVMNALDTGEGYPAGMAQELAGIESSQRPSAVLTMIVEKNGEAPRRPGTKMLVRKDGSFLGTVGGGYAEAQILKAAADMLQRESMDTRLVRISMTKGAMYCGGEILVFLLPL